MYQNPSMATTKRNQWGRVVSAPQDTATTCIIKWDTRGAAVIYPVLARLVVRVTMVSTSLRDGIKTRQSYPPLWCKDIINYTKHFTCKSTVCCKLYWLCSRMKPQFEAYNLEEREYESIDSFASDFWRTFLNWASREYIDFPLTEAFRYLYMNFSVGVNRSRKNMPYLTLFADVNSDFKSCFMSTRSFTCLDILIHWLSMKLHYVFMSGNQMRSKYVKI